MAAVRLPFLSPISTIVFASSIASSVVFINAPLPVFTSSKMQSAPLASFLLIILLAISGMLGTVAVTSRRAYSFLSAGARSAVCPITATPMVFTWLKKSSSLISTLAPGIDSILSSVPPVCPRPLPLILATFTPHTARIGAITSVVLSPTPPVECLSTLTPSILLKSTVSPLCAIAAVSCEISRISMPLKYIAMHSAAACSWGMLPQE